MSQKSKKIMRRLIAVFIAIIIVAAIALSRSSDRVLHATSVSENENAAVSEETVPEESLDQEDVVVEIPSEEEPSSEDVEPETVTEPTEPSGEIVIPEPSSEEVSSEEPSSQKPEEPASQESESQKEEEPESQEPDSQKEEEPESQKPDSDKPKQKIRVAAADGAVVTVSAPEGALPAGAYVVVNTVSPVRAAGLIEQMLESGEELVGVAVYDITIFDAEGNEIQPDERVRVSITGANVEAGDNASVYHVTDSGYAEKVADIPDVSQAVFSADSFSEYVVASTSSSYSGNEEDGYTLTVGGTLQLPKPSGYSSYSYSSSNTSVASVSSGGLVTAKKEGVATITLTAKTGGWFSSTKKFYYTVTVGPVVREPGITVTPTTASLTELGQTASFLAKLSLIDSENTIVWTSSDETVATVENGVVTAKGAGTATITASVSPEEDELYGNTYSDSATVNVRFTDYDLYHYALIPGMDANVTDGSANERWFGIGTSKISGVKSAASYSTGKVINDYIVGAETKALYPNLTYGGVTYKYAPAGSANAGEYGYYTLQPFRVTVSNGANAGYNGYNPVVERGNTFHLDYICILNEKNNFSVNFAVQYPGGGLEGLTDYAQRVKEGTAFSAVRQPTASVVPQTMKRNNITYQFDGWYTDSGFTQPADFSGNVTANTTFYARYVATDAFYKVEYYYDGVLDASLTDRLGPVVFGTTISTYTNKPKTGFNFSEISPVRLTVGQDENANVMRVYYTKRLVNYKVGYYLNGTDEQIAPSVTKSARYGEIGTGNLLAIEGYTPVSSEKTKSQTIESSGTEIRFEYYKNTTLTTNSGTFTYDAAEHSVSGFLSSEPQADFSAYSATVTKKDAGTYPVSFERDMNGRVDATGRYIVTDITEGTLVIERAAVTVKAADAGKTYGAQDPELSAQITGLPEADKDVLTYEITRDPGENVGSYTIHVSGNAQQGNYDVSYEDGVFAITPSDSLALSVTGYEGVYDGASHSLIASANIAEGTTLSYSVDGGTTFSGELPSIKDAGEQTVLVRAENANFETVTAEAVLKVTPRPVTISADPQSKIYGHSDPAFTASVSGLIEGAITYNTRNK